KSQTLFQQCKKLVKRSPFPYCDIVSLSGSIRIFRGRSQQVGLHNIFDEAEIAGRLSIAIDDDRLTLEQRGNPFGNYGGVSAVRVLARPEHIKITQTD